MIVLLSGVEEFSVGAVLKNYENLIHINTDAVFSKGLGNERANKKLEREDEASEGELEVEGEC